MSTWKNIKIKSSVGKFYESSKTAVEGWEQIETEEHGTRWHRVFSNLKGKLTKVAIDEEGKFGDRLKIYVETDTDEVSVLELTLFNVNKTMNDYVKTFCTRLGNIRLGDEVDIFLNTKYKDKSDYLKKFVVVKIDDTIVEKALDKDSVPKWEEKPDPIKKGKTYWDRTAETAFYYEYLSNWIESNRPSSDSEPNNTTQNTTTPVTKEKAVIKKEVEVAVTSADDDDSLPF